MIFASEAFSQSEVDAVLNSDCAPSMLFKAHDGFIKAVIQTNEKARRLLDDLKGCERDIQLCRAFKKAVIAPKIYAIGGNSKPTDVFGNETPRGWDYGYWLDMYDNVKEASEAFLVDVGMKNGGKLPVLSSVDFMMQLADLALCSARLHRGYIDAMEADDFFRKESAEKKDAAQTDEEIKYAVGMERYADRMMTGVGRMLHYQTGLPIPESEYMAEAMAYEKRQFAALDAAEEEERRRAFLEEYQQD